MLRNLIASFLLLFSVVTANAIDLEYNPELKTLNISGEFVLGDYAKYMLYVQNKEIQMVFLSSVGGIVGEAMSIAEDIKNKNKMVIVPQGAVCFSACAFVWSFVPDRALQEGSVLGYHALFGILPDGNTVSDRYTSSFLGYIIGSSGASADMLLDIVDVAPNQGIMIYNADTREKYLKKWHISYKLIPSIEELSK